MTARLAWTEAKIVRIEHATPRVLSVLLEAPIGPYLAGQHVDVRLTAEDGYQAQRSYSIASAPGAPLLELAIERLQDGEVSSYFDEIAEVGDAIELRGPIGGHFIWRAENPNPVLLVGGGSGVAPLMSMVRHRAAAARGTPMLLVYSARTWEDVIFRDELLALEARGDGFSLVLATTRGPAQRPGDFSRRIDADAVFEILARWKRPPRDVFVCGSNAFVEAAVKALVAQSAMSASIKTERFGGTGG
jgi:ferredoxin-NADP reductase